MTSHPLLDSVRMQFVAAKGRHPAALFKPATDTWPT